MPVEVATVSISTPFNVAVLLSLRNSRNKGRANIKGFTVFGLSLGGTMLYDVVPVKLSQELILKIVTFLW